MWRPCVSYVGRRYVVFALEASCVAFLGTPVGAVSWSHRRRHALNSTVSLLWHTH